MTKNSPLFIDIGQGMSVPVGQLTVSCWSNLNRPNNPTKGTFGFNTDTNSLEIWNGIEWFATPLTIQQT